MHATFSAHQPGYATAPGSKAAARAARPSSRSALARVNRRRFVIIDEVLGAPFWSSMVSEAALCHDDESRVDKHPHQNGTTKRRGTKHRRFTGQTDPWFRNCHERKCAEQSESSTPCPPRNER